MEHINDLTREEIRAILADRGQPAYRATQICEWLYKRRAKSFDEMTNLPLELRDNLAKHFSIARLRPRDSLISEADGAAKYMLELDDGNRIESVYLPHPRGATLCISSQVGCAFACRFCATGTMGLSRDLTPGEMVDQVSLLEEHIPQEPVTEEEETTQAARPFSNIVFMGMGEPLANYDNLVKALDLLIKEMRIGSRRITVSTCGLPERIIRFAEEPYEVGLAISLNSPFDTTRKQLMPRAARAPLVEIMNAARYYHHRKGRMLTFEYVLIADVNDRVRDAHELAGLMREVPAKINLIALNPFPGCRYRSPDPARVRRFQTLLESRGKKVTLRRSLGCDILAACGQLGARKKD